MNLRFVRGFRDYVNRTGTTTVDGPPLQVRPRLEEIFQAVVLGLHQKQTHIHTYTHTHTHTHTHTNAHVLGLHQKPVCVCVCVCVCVHVHV